MQNGEPAAVLADGRLLLAAGADAHGSSGAHKRPDGGSSWDGIRGVRCTNHPWRQAYSYCRYCKRPFCYADLIEEDGECYCMEDTGAIKHAGQATMRGSAAMNFVGALLIANAVVVAVMIYSHLLFALNLIGTSGVGALLSSLNTGWIVFYVNVALVVLGLISGIVVMLSKSRLGQNVGKLIIFATIIAMAYQYMVSFYAYLLLMIVAEIFTLALLAYVSMSISLNTYERDMLSKKPSAERAGY